MNCRTWWNITGLWFHDFTPKHFHLYHSLGCQKGSQLVIGQLPDLFRTTHLRIAHDRFGSSSDPTHNGTLHYPNPNDIDRSLNETVTDKIRKYRVDYNNNPPNAISFIPTIGSTWGRVHSEFIRLLFLQDHRETDRFFATSGVQSAQSNLGSSYFHFRHATFTSIRERYW